MSEDKIELVIQMQQGSREAFEKIFEEYQLKAIRTAYLITNHKALAEDIAQETFVQCFVHKNSLKDPAQFKPWFFKILTRITWRACKKEKKVTPVEEIYEEANLEEDNTVEKIFLQREQAEMILSEIHKLGMKQKMTVLLYYYNEFSVSEIAEIMDCFEGTVKSRLHSARKRLKKRLEERKICDKEDVEDAILYKI